MRSALGTFVGVYLDEDLVERYGDDLSAVDAFIRDDPERAIQLPAVIARVLDRQPTEGDLVKLLDGYGIGIEIREPTYREWLTKISAHVQVATTSGD